MHVWGVGIQDYDGHPYYKLLMCWCINTTQLSGAARGRGRARGRGGGQANKTPRGGFAAGRGRRSKPLSAADFLISATQLKVFFWGFQKRTC